MKNQIEIIVGAELFRFSSFDNWCDTAKFKFERSGHTRNTAICLDSIGRVCDYGLQFKRAKEENTYPIRVFERVVP